jgi:GDP-L-fucose synthase
LATEIEDRDLTDPAVIRRHLDFQPDQMIHLAAIVRGIGADRERPAEFFYQNLMMGVQLMYACWQAGVSKFMAIGTICASPKVYADSVQGR